ncbi:glycosyltransferase [uncultured Fibrobacter sp.]|uniref:glycosyltransferase n=1 Tax=uncultured Fibrobacter sp. TaxID=261512 RepID=UPI002635D903|nr:glycosyltransferase [uncultured Fibrobacter sp.]
MKVLVAPLDWGLGHATRCAPVVREFLEKGCDVELAVTRGNAAILREMFPDVRQRLAPSYNIVYPKHGYNMAFWLLKNSAHLRAVMRAEHHYAEEMVERHGYDILVSDNRFAFRSRKAKSVYMTHQCRIAFPKMLRMFEAFGAAWHASVMSRFDEVWVPDVPEFPGYAGSLSHVERCPRPLKFVGPLSRFAMLPLTQSTEKDLNIVAVVSGVEPARSRFASRLSSVLPQIPGKHVVILGKPASSLKTWTAGNVTFYNHLPTQEFADVISRAGWVISRGGYSTVMDMAVLGAKCIFVPTPGQYEQVVLAADLSAAGFAVSIEEGSLSVDSLSKALQRADVVELPRQSKNTLLSDAVTQILRRT